MIKLLAVGVTDNAKAALEAFAAATNHNGAMAPRALTEILAREGGDIDWCSGWLSALSAAVSLADLRAGDRWPNGPAGFRLGIHDQGNHYGTPRDAFHEDEYYEIAREIKESGIELPDAVHLSAATFGGGRSRVGLLAPHQPHPNDRQPPAHNMWVVVAWVNVDGDATLWEWDYRAESIRALAAKSC